MLEFLEARPVEVIAGIVAILAFFATLRASHVASRMANLETKPHLLVELVDGEMHYISQNGRVLKNTPNGPVEQPLMIRIVNAGRTSATCTRLCRVLEMVDVPEGKRGFPSHIDLTKIPDHDAYNKDGCLFWSKSIEFAAGTNAPSAPISANVNTDAISKIKDRRFSTQTWVYFRGFIEFENNENKKRGRSGYCFLFVPRNNGLGFFVSLDRTDCWYYAELGWRSKLRSLYRRRKTAAAPPPLPDPDPPAT